MTPTGAGRTSTGSRRRRWPASLPTGQQDPARARQGDQLRHHVRPLGVRPVGAGRHARRRGARLHRRLLREVPARQGLSREGHRGGARGRLRHDRLRAPPRRARAARPQLPRALARRAPGREHRAPGQRRRHHQGGHAAGDRGARRRRRCAAASSCRSTTSSSSRAPTTRSRSCCHWCGRRCAAPSTWTRRSTSAIGVGDTWLSAK